MKTHILDIEGKKVKEIELPEVFETPVREDILHKVFEAMKWKKKQPYGVSPEAGKKYSASGKIRHRRHKWKTHYGRGISRIPRKIMWRRGAQFYWIGASVPGARGGRKAHPPKAEKVLKKKINKKEMILAIKGAIASTADSEAIKKRYARLKERDKEKEIKISAPFIVESKITTLKTKELVDALKKILNELFEIALPKKSIRAGKGKIRGRKYKKTAGVLIVVGKDEQIKTKNIPSKKLNELEISDLYPAGRLVIYTEKAIKQLGEVKDKEIKKEKK